MKQLIYSILIFFVLSCVTSKPGLKKNDKAIFYANTITAKELNKHLSVLASDEYEGRETGKKGQIMSAEYLKNEFIKDGVGPGNNGKYLQYFPLIETSKPEAELSINNIVFSFLEDFYFFDSYADFSNFSLNMNEIESVGYGITTENHDDYGKEDYTGKTVIINADRSDKHGKWGWRKKIEAAREKGVKQVIFTTENFDINLGRLKHFLEKSSQRLDMNEKKENKNIPFFFISEGLHKQIKKTQEDSSKEGQMKFHYVSKDKKIKSSNVLGFIEGTDEKLKKEVIVITAHYDHLGIKEGLVYNGADDDGTGTSALLEIAEAFQKAKDDGNGTKRSILIMPVSGEEKGLLGSRYYTENPVFPIENTVADLNIDMIGRMDTNHTDPNYVYLIGADKISQDLHDISEATNSMYSNLNLDYTFNDENDPNRFYYRSDHYNFAQKGIPVIFYFSGVHEDYHKHTDEIDKIMFDKVEKITRLVFYTAWEIANRTERLKVNKK